MTQSKSSVSFLMPENNNGNKCATKCIFKNMESILSCTKLLSDWKMVSNAYNDAEKIVQALTGAAGAEQKQKLLQHTAVVYRNLIFAIMLQKTVNARCLTKLTQMLALLTQVRPSLATTYLSKLNLKICGRASAKCYVRGGLYGFWENLLTIFPISMSEMVEEEICNICLHIVCSLREMITSLHAPPEPEQVEEVFCVVRFYMKMLLALDNIVARHLWSKECGMLTVRICRLLIKVLLMDVCPSSLRLLSATALARTIRLFPDETTVLKTIHELYVHLGNNYKVSLDSFTIVMDHVADKLNEQLSANVSIYHIMFLHGILTTCSEPNYFFKQVDAAFLHNFSVNELPANLGCKLFCAISGLFRLTKLQYYCLECLILWYRTMQELFLKTNKTLLGYASENMMQLKHDCYLSITYEMVMTGLDSPLAGVGKQAKNLLIEMMKMAVLLEKAATQGQTITIAGSSMDLTAVRIGKYVIYKIGRSAICDTFGYCKRMITLDTCLLMDFGVELLRISRSSSNKNRSRYVLLEVLLPFLGLDVVMSEERSLWKSIDSTMSSSYLAPIFADFFKVVCSMVAHTSSTDSHSKFLKEPYLMTYSMTPETLNMYRATLVSSVTEGLTSNNKVAFTHTAHLLLPALLQSFPEAYRLLCENIAACGEDEESKLLAYLIVDTKVRALGQAATERQAMYSIHNALVHQREDIRSSAFAYICATAATSAPLMRVDLKELLRALPHNMYSESKPFRHDLIKNFRAVLVRIRDSCASRLKAASMTTEEANGDNHYATVQEHLEFASSLWELCLNHLVPDARFQRCKVALDIMSSILNILTYSPEKDQHRKKGAFPNSAKIVLEHTKAYNMWNWFSVKACQTLLIEILHEADEIQEAAFDILLNHFPTKLPLVSPTLSKEKDIEMLHMMQIVSLVHKAIILCLSPKSYDTSSGARLMELLFYKYVYRQGWKFQLDWDMGAFSFAVRLDRIKQPPAQAMRDFLVLIIAWMSDCVKEAKANPLIAAKVWPAHGFLVALRHCMFRPEFVNEGLLNYCDELVPYCVHVCNLVLHGAMAALGIKLDTADSSSFEKMNQSVAQLIQTHGGVRDHNGMTLTDDHQKVMTWAWTSVKEVCSFYSKLVEPHDFTKAGTLSTIVPTNLVQCIMENFKSILVRCRHRGIIVNCASAFAEFCSSLLRSSNGELRAIPSAFLESLLAMLRDHKDTAASITRRSAGLPLMVQSLLVAETAVRTGERHSGVEKCMRFLLNVWPNPPRVDMNETVDLPQVHAFNIMAALVRESRLTSVLTQYITDIIKQAISGFGHEAWTVRNASVQLLSALLNLIFGQQTSWDDLVSSIPPETFFNTYRGLEQFLEDMLLAASAKVQKDPRANIQDIFPILTILSRLAPSMDLSISRRQVIAECLVKLSVSCMRHMRELAARSLAPLLATSEVYPFLKSLSEIIPRTRADCVGFNHLDGHLLQLQAHLYLLLGCRCMDDTAKLRMELEYVEMSLVACTWINTDENPCWMVRHLYCQLLSTLSEATGNRRTVNITTLLRHAADHTSVQVGQSLFVSEEIYRSFFLNDSYGMPLDIRLQLCLLSEVAIVMEKALKGACDAVLLGIKKKIYNSGDMSDILAVIVKNFNCQDPTVYPREVVKALLDVLFRLGQDPELFPSFPEQLEAYLRWLLGNQGYWGNELIPSALGVLTVLTSVRHYRKQLAPGCVESWVNAVSDGAVHMSTPEVRLWSAISLRLLAPKLVTSLLEIDRHSIKIEKVIFMICETCIHLLLDDVESVRHETAKAVAALPWIRPVMNGGSPVPSYTLSEFLAKPPLGCWNIDALPMIVLGWLNRPSVLKVVEDHTSLPANLRGLFASQVELYREESFVDRQIAKAVMDGLRDAPEARSVSDIDQRHLCGLVCELEDCIYLLEANCSAWGLLNVACDDRVYVGLSSTMLQIQVMVFLNKAATDNSIITKLMELVQRLNLLPLHPMLLEVMDTLTQVVFSSHVPED